MKELTIDYLKQVAKRYNKESELYKKLPSIRGMSVPQHFVHAMLIQSVFTFSSDEQMKKFLNSNLLLLTKKDIKEIFGFKRPSLKEHSDAILQI